MADQTQEQKTHEEQMIQKVDDLHQSLVSQTAPQTGEQTQPAQRPAEVPEQFWDAEKGQVNQEALLKAYLEATAGKQEQTQEQKQQDQQQDPEQKAAEDALKAAKLDVNAVRAEFDKNGRLSDDTYKALENAGFGRDVVDDFIAGQHARAQLIASESFSLAGGQESYQKMVQWAATGLSPADVQAFDKAVTGADPAARKQAIIALKAQYEAAVGKDPSLVKGQVGNAGSVTPFASRAEVVQAMRDPRYTSDPAYRAEVARRVDAMETF